MGRVQASHRQGLDLLECEAAGGTEIAQRRDRAIRVTQHDINGAVVVPVEDRKPRTSVVRSEWNGIAELPGTKIRVDHAGLVSHISASQIQRAASDNDVQIAVTVDVGE